MSEEYQRGQKQFQEWLRAHEGYAESKLRENILWTLEVRKKSLPEYKPRYQACVQAWIDELNKLLENL